jgi:hypothetical protein
MALNGDTLGAAIATAINGLSANDKNDIAKVWKAIANQIITHVKTATVTVPGTGLTAPNGPVGGTSTSGSLS